MSIKNRDFMRPFQDVGLLGQTKGIVSVVVPVSYLYDAICVSMSYEITDDQHCNKVDFPKISRCCVDGSPWPSNDPIELVPNNEVISNLSMVLNYFKHVRDLLIDKNCKEIPPRLEDFIGYNVGCGLSIPF